MKYLLLAIAFTIGACAAATPTSEVVQGLCQLDPHTGRCKTNLDENDVQSVTEHYIATNYQEAVYQDNFSCFSESSYTECGVYVEYRGHQYYIWCDADDATGEITCGVAQEY